MKNLGKVLLGLGLYLTSRKVVFLILDIFIKLRFRFPLRINGIVHKMFGGFLPSWVIQWGAVVFLIAGFVVIILADEKKTDKKYFSPLIIAGAVLSIIFIVFNRSLRDLIKIVVLRDIINIVPYILIIAGYWQLINGEAIEQITAGTRLFKIKIGMVYIPRINVGNLSIYLVL